MSIEKRFIKRWSFEYFYMILMIIYMAQMSTATSRLLGSLSRDFIPLLIPVIPTLYLFFKYKISLNAQFIKTLVIFLIWFIAIFIKYNTSANLGFVSYHLTFLLSFFIVYTHVKVFGTSFPDIYEDIIVKFAMISLLLWLFSLIPLSSSFFRMFPLVAQGSTAEGTNLLYIYHWLDPLAPESYNSFSIPRNSGLTWEPGRYSVILSLALWNNLSNNGTSFKRNKNAIILLLAVLTTFSTTGYFVVACLYAYYFLNGFYFRDFIKISIIVIPAFIIMMNFDFMGEKISKQANILEESENFYTQEDYYSNNGGRDNHVSLNRILSLSLELENIKHDPILGYSRNVSYSWFGQNFSEKFSLTGGLLKTIGQFGIFLGLFFYYSLFKSSRILSDSKKHKRKYALAIIFLLGSVSYNLLGSAIFTTFWFIGVFGDIPSRIFRK